MWIHIPALLYLVVLSVYDCKEKAVPLSLLYVGGGGALFLLLYRVITMFLDVDGMWDIRCCVGIVLSLAVGLVPGVLMILMSVLTQRVGMADGVVLTMLGALLGFWKVLLIVYISLLCFGVWAVVLLLSGKIRMKETLPYLPFLTIGVAVELLVASAWK